jgi:hypothetical protein
MSVSLLCVPCVLAYEAGSFAYLWNGAVEPISTFWLVRSGGLVHRVVLIEKRMGSPDRWGMAATRASHAFGDEPRV